MDPVTIAAFCITVARNLTGFLTGLSNLRDCYRDAPMNARIIIDRSRTLRAAANRMRDWLDEHGDELLEDERESIVNTIGTCEMLTNLLLQRVEEAVEGSKKKRVWTKIKVVWGQDRIDEYTRTLSQQVDALSLHLQIIDLWVARPLLIVRQTLINADQIRRRE